VGGTPPKAAEERERIALSSREVERIAEMIALLQSAIDTWISYVEMSVYRRPNGH
jgi:uncharacterized protein (DUF2384 family)